MFTSALKLAFHGTLFRVIGVLAVLAIFLFVAGLPDYRLYLSILELVSMSLVARVLLAFQMFGIILLSRPLLVAYAIVLAVLMVSNLGLFIYLVRNRINFWRQSGNASVTVFGFGSGVLGLGCAACGTLVLSGLAGFLGGAAILAVLPFGGKEFGIVGVIMLATSFYVTAKWISKPAVCGI